MKINLFPLAATASMGVTALAPVTITSPPAIVRQMPSQSTAKLESIRPSSIIDSVSLSKLGAPDIRTPSLVPLPISNHVLAKRVLNIAPLFGANGPQCDDVVQGDLGDCFLLSLLAAMAEHQPQALANIFYKAEHATDQYQIRYFEPRTGLIKKMNVFDTTYLNPKGKPLYAGDNPDKTIGSKCSWVKVIENWYAKMNEQYQLQNGKAGFTGIASGGWSAIPYKLMTGKGMDILGPEDFQEFDFILQQANEHKIVIVVSNTKTFSEYYLPPTHAYAVLGTQGDQVSLYDPYGRKVTLDKALLYDNVTRVLMESNA